MNITSGDLSLWSMVICFAVFAGLMLVTIILASRSRMKYAQRIMQAQARGAFDDLGTPQARSRHRWKAILTLAGLLGRGHLVCYTHASNLHGVEARSTVD